MHRTAQLVLKLRGAVKKTMRGENYLFSEVEWRSFERRRKQEMLYEINAIEGNRLLNTSADDLCDYFKEKYRFDVPTLHEDQIVLSQMETPVDVSQDLVRHILDRSRPCYITGTTVEITIPFSGDKEAFKIQPTSFTLNPPFANVRNNSLILDITGIDMEPGNVRNRIDHTISEVKQYLGWLQADSNAFNEQIGQFARRHIESRRQKLLEDQKLVAALGFPLKERVDVPETFTAPDVRRKIVPAMPSGSGISYEPEPVLSTDDYEHILSVMNNMVLVMERSPSDFVSMSEETLRSHFLVQLNGHYEGQATGETFNHGGRTDILIRVEGKNIFIAECKYWRGPKELSKTVDQLLGYTSWRDTKTAILIFNRNKNFSKVLEIIPAVIEAHPNFKRTVNPSAESRFRYIFGHKDDPNREMILVVLAFDIPRS